MINTELRRRALRLPINRDQNAAADWREDRVVIYGSFDDRITTISYRVKLTSSGSFVLPAAYAGSMYDRSVQAHTKPGRFDVSAVQ